MLRRVCTLFLCFIICFIWDNNIIIIVSHFSLVFFPFPSKRNSTVSSISSDWTLMNFQVSWYIQVSSEMRRKTSMLSFSELERVCNVIIITFDEILYVKKWSNIILESECEENLMQCLALCVVDSRINIT